MPTSAVSTAPPSIGEIGARPIDQAAENRAEDHAHRRRGGQQPGHGALLFPLHTETGRRH